MTCDLDRAGEVLVRRLGGTWSNGKGMCRCPAHPDHNPSLSVRIGRKTLLFKCFAGCTTRDILIALRAERLAWPTLPAGAELSPVRPRAFDKAALRLWSASVPLGGTAGALYLARRGIATGSPALRYHDAAPLGAGRTVRFLSAMIAAVSRNGRVCGVQRLFLTREGRLAPMRQPKRSLGTISGGAVMLAPATGSLGIAEGVENALSASILFGIPVWSTLGSACFDQAPIPASVTRLLLLADNDPAGRHAVERARKAYRVPGRDILIFWPPAPHNDWNEVLQAGGEEGWKWVRNMA